MSLADPSACTHHEHDNSDPAVWAATIGTASIGDFCADHLGDGLDGFDSEVRLNRIEEVEDR